MLFSFFFGPYAARLQIVEVSQCCVNLMRLSWARMTEGAEKEKKKKIRSPGSRVERRNLDQHLDLSFSGVDVTWLEYH